MAKVKVVAFKNGKAKILTFPDKSLVVEGDGVHINPDMSQVKGLSPELWAEDVDGKIVPNTNKKLVKPYGKKSTQVMLGEAVLNSKKLKKMLVISIALNIILGLLLGLK
jgi:hypothetical protein